VDGDWQARGTGVRENNGDATKNGNQRMEGVTSPRSAESTLTDVVIKRHPVDA
jgi:hypothetical protein